MKIADYLNPSIEGFTVTVDRAAKAYSTNRLIFSNITFEVENRDIVAITGRNGSGKTTLLKLLCRLTAPTAGSVGFQLCGNNHDASVRDFVSLVGPYLNLYEEFTPLEHLALAYRLRGRKTDYGPAEKMLQHFGLFARRNDPIRTFSSGMKQRMKYILAVARKPYLLLLDEPYSNLDDEAIAIVGELIESQVALNGAVVIASNDEREYRKHNKSVSLNIE